MALLLQALENAGADTATVIPTIHLGNVVAFKMHITAVDRTVNSAELVEDVFLLSQSDGGTAVGINGDGFHYSLQGLVHIFYFLSTLFRWCAYL